MRGEEGSSAVSTQWMTRRTHSEARIWRTQLTDSAEFTLRRDLLMIIFRSSSVMPWMASSIFTPRRCKSRSR